MNELTLFKSELFNGIECNLWKDEDSQIWMTREQIGSALEYSNPREAIKNIHSRNKERLDKFSRVAQIDTPYGRQEMYIYNTKGVYEVCRYSKQTKANDFYDWVYELLEGLRTGELQVLYNQLQEVKPKLEFYNQCLSAQNNMTMLQVAKILKLNGRNKIFKFLRDEDILMTKSERHNIPRQQFIDAGYFQVVIKPMFIQGVILDIPVTLVTPRGLQYILKRWNKKKDLQLKQAN
jgi:phage antirepressor YoqD-like protein